MLLLFFRWGVGVYESLFCVSIVLGGWRGSYLFMYVCVAGWMCKGGAGAGAGALRA